jgi:hypothetical protein
MYENIASKLQLSPQDLERASLLLFLKHRLRACCFRIKRKAGSSSTVVLHGQTRVITKS